MSVTLVLAEVLRVAAREAHAPEGILSRRALCAPERPTNCKPIRNYVPELHRAHGTANAFNIATADVAVTLLAHAEAQFISTARAAGSGVEHHGSSTSKAMVHHLSAKGREVGDSRMAT